MTEGARTPQLNSPLCVNYRTVSTQTVRDTIYFQSCLKKMMNVSNVKEEQDRFVAVACFAETVLMIILVSDSLKQVGGKYGYAHFELLK